MTPLASDGCSARGGQAWSIGAQCAADMRVVTMVMAAACTDMTVGRTGCHRSVHVTACQSDVLWSCMLLISTSFCFWCQPRMAAQGWVDLCLWFTGSAPMTQCTLQIEVMQIVPLFTSLSICLTLSGQGRSVTALLIHEPLSRHSLIVASQQ